MNRIISIASLLVALVALVACGNAGESSPQLSNLDVQCVDSENENLGQIVDVISVDVDDPDRDLVNVEGRVNGVQITLTDDDADAIYTWQPPEDSEPLACRGDFYVTVTATDKAGNASSASKVISK